jgi:hypothetical protein
MTLQRLRGRRAVCANDKQDSSWIGGAPAGYEVFGGKRFTRLACAPPPA